VGEKMQKQTGWYFLKSNNPKIKPSLAYHCALCGISYVFGENEPKAWCCGKWITLPEKTWLSSELPTVQSAVPWRPTMLPGRVIDFSEGAESENAQMFS
jgi:hypothetical protein